MKYKIVIQQQLLLICLSIFLWLQTNAQTNAFNATNKPWTRWWWMGSAVDEVGIKKQLTQLAAVGFGGVEIVPIYGAKGFEKRYIKYLSPEWMKMLDFTVAEAKRLNMGVYISVGTGWPIGGSNVTINDAATKLITQKYTLKANEPLTEKIVVADAKQKGFAQLSSVMVYAANKQPIDVTEKVNDEGVLNYVSTTNAEIVAIFIGKTRQAVKRAAPGGEGYTIDHFSKNATANYFTIFDSAFGNSSHGVQAFFNDSYEVYNADWTPEFFSEFEKRRGYNLKNWMNAFISKAHNDTVARLKSDYRETIADLMLENFSSVFTKWTNKRNTKSVNQAHGSPGNLLDLYGAFDIPECETFGSTAFGVKNLRRDSGDVRNVDPDPIMLKFASSAAHFYNKPLTSSETFTWLGEHFKTSWSQCKPEVDQVFLSGVNHVFYHGTTYTPADVKFPGWLFYASVNFVPYNSLWKHVKGLNEYISRVQQVLQGTPANNIKMYWPIYDVWHEAEGVDMPLSVHHIKEWLHPTPFYKNVTQLQNTGYEVDFVSDKMIAEWLKRAVLLKKQKEVLVIPTCNLMPVKTLQNIIDLAKKNVDEIVIQSLPTDVPGMHNLVENRKQLQQLIQSLQLVNVGNGIAESKLKLAGKIIVCADLNKALEYLRVRNESTITQLGLKFITSYKNNSKYYFVSNNTAKDIDTTIRLQVMPQSLQYINPLNGETGKVAFKNMGSYIDNVRLQLKSGESIIVQANFQPSKQLPNWKYKDVSKQVIDLTNLQWKINFTEGGPFLPTSKTIEKIQPWTNIKNDTTLSYFSGTAIYSTQFQLKNKSKSYLLQFEKLHESARIIVNGKEVGLVWSLPYEIKIDQYLREGNNTIQIEVCNLMANRMRYMDAQKEVWRNYHEINFVNINYKPFDASNWQIQPAGLDGFVRLIQLQ